jgi:hypothetical protein
MTTPPLARLLPVALTLLIGGCGSEDDIVYQENTDTYAQAPNNEVDILWVVDNSFSMAEEQQALASGFDSFASQLATSGTVFQLGIISTSFDYDDETRGTLIGDPPFLTNEFAGYEEEFKSRALVGIEGSGKEKGLEATLHALDPVMTFEGQNDGFVRPSAELLVIWVSDEDDCSDGGALEGQDDVTCYTEWDQLTPVEDIVQDLYEVKGDRDLVSVGAIVGTTTETCPNGSEVVEGKRYVSAVRHMGGLVGDICDSDWSGVLGDLGLTATGIHTMFQLSQAAQMDTIVVTVDEVEVAEDAADGWTYNELTWWLEFHGTSVPARGSQITVKYTVDPGKLEPETATTTN